MNIRLPYALAAALVLAVEIVVALFIHDRIIRPHLGDSLAVILVYLGLRAFTPLRVLPSNATALAIATAIEFGQLFHLVDRLGLGGNAVARVVIGTGFDPKDFAAYAAGGVLVLLIEAVRRERFI